jgi:hypothetical protein
MAGSITVSSITLDSDNNFSIKSNTGATLFFANTSGVDIANSIGATAITNDKILSVANTKISGNIISSQITSVANTQITGNIISSQITSVANTQLTGTLLAASFPSGSIVQVATSCPAPARVALGTTSWTEVSSSFRVSITPKFASSTLLIQCIFMFGGRNDSTLSHFKIYDITNSADVNLHTGDGSRTPMHGSARHVDTDTNDVDQMVLGTTVSAGSTSARTYSLYSKNESGTNSKFFFGTNSDASAIGVARPTFVVYEIVA